MSIIGSVYLIIFVVLGGVINGALHSQAVPFATKEACEAAKVALRADAGNKIYVASCIESDK